jgi:hypothetical protein
MTKQPPGGQAYFDVAAAARELARHRLEGECRVLAKEAVIPHLRPGIGFALLLFDFGDGGGMAYMSNAEREDMIQAVEELLAELKCSGKAAT